MPKTAAIESVNSKDPAVEIEVPCTAAAPEEQTSTANPDSLEPAAIPWHQFLEGKVNHPDIKNRFAEDMTALIRRFDLGHYCVLALLEPDDGIDSTDLDQTFTALCSSNPE